MPKRLPRSATLYVLPAVKTRTEGPSDADAPLEGETGRVPKRFPRSATLYVLPADKTRTEGLLEAGRAPSRLPGNAEPDVQLSDKDRIGSLFADDGQLEGEAGRHEGSRPP